jgi:hypothetical protein
MRERVWGMVTERGVRGRRVRTSFVSANSCSEEEKDSIGSVDKDLAMRNKFKSQATSM